MTPLPFESDAAVHWDFSYDAEWFLPLPTSDDLHREPLAGEEWIEGAVAHYTERAELTAGDREALTVTAEALLSLVGNAATQLWFTPRGVYSDVVVEVTVAAAAAMEADKVLEELATLPDATASELIALDTDAHGHGFLLRRTSAVVLEDQARPIANWTVLLRKGEWAIMVMAMGSTLEAFALMEEHILRVVQGITLPSGSPQ
ncbi:MAG: hypothetical protein WAK00_10180 [Microbacterium sp.]|uniref:hypothetical protein n=1 Tax=Microbacterium sp. TaxID=51671 RepID=UPI003BAE9105